MIDRNAVLEMDYLNCRCMLLELAAALDRYDRAPSMSAGEKPVDERETLLRQAIQILADHSDQPDRAKRMLQLMSDPVN
jgi:hypothetical protein